MGKVSFDCRLYLVTDRRWLGDRNLSDAVEEAILGGVTLLQLREKDLSSQDYYHLAVKVKKTADKYHVPLIINDRLDIALAVDAAGVHLGLDDLPIPVVRKILGKDRIIGASAATVAEALLFQQQGADYLGVGAVFPTATKLGNEQVGFADLRRIKAAVCIPVAAIGGIKAENARDVMATGVDGVAVVSAIMDQRDIGAATRKLVALINQVKEETA
ncbi:MAG: thiamine phosphate synthase [Deltaproteobacteria bacterium]|nr:thiamine phosphate synthase [Deltaproteobacteria bacterium]